MLQDGGFCHGLQLTNLFWLNFSRCQNCDVAFQEHVQNQALRGLFESYTSRFVSLFYFTNLLPNHMQYLLFILQDLVGQQFPNCQRYSRKLGVNFPVSLQSIRFYCCILQSFQRWWFALYTKKGSEKLQEVTNKCFIVVI